jgi:hypothetical protein
MLCCILSSLSTREILPSKAVSLTFLSLAYFKVAPVSTAFKRPSDSVKPSCAFLADIRLLFAGFWFLHCQCLPLGTM